jgi:hypothetical protein
MCVKKEVLTDYDKELLERIIVSEFSFFKAGQGAFYGGRIWNRHANGEEVYTVVYDCGTSTYTKGSVSALEEEIFYFKTSHSNFPISGEGISIQEKKIDLLFISHLDYDHVSGLKSLLEEFKVKRIILPYVNKKIRKFSILSFPYEDLPDVTGLSLDEYVLFLDNPISIIDSEETEIFFVTPEGESLSYRGYSENGLHSSGDINNDDNEYKNDPKTGNKVNIYKNNLQFFISNRWEFTTYLKSTNQDVIDNLNICLLKCVGKKAGEELSLDDLKILVTTKQRKAKSYYKENFKNVNLYGLILLHGPINYAEVILSGSENHGSYACYYMSKSITTLPLKELSDNDYPPLGTLLMGDASLNTSRSGQNKNNIFPDQLLRKLSRLHVFQVPHHGSIKNWNKEAYNELLSPLGKNNYGFTIPVCNFGLGNIYGHPSPQIICDLNPFLFLNTQCSRLNIIYHAFYDKKN